MSHHTTQTSSDDNSCSIVNVNVNIPLYVTQTHTRSHVTTPLAYYILKLPNAVVNVHLRAAVRAPVSLAVLLGFTCLIAFVYFVYFYEQINDYDDDIVDTYKTKK